MCRYWNMCWAACGSFRDKRLLRLLEMYIRILLKSWVSYSVLHPYNSLSGYLEVRYQEGQPALETWGQSCTMSPALLLGSWLREEIENPSKSTRCNISLGISLGLPERPTQLSLRDTTWCLPRFYLPKAGRKEMLAPLADEPWILFCCWERTWSDCSSALRTAEGRANPGLPTALPATPARPC